MRTIKFYSVVLSLVLLPGGLYTMDAIISLEIVGYTEILIDNLTWLILILSQHLIQLTG